MRKKIVSVMYRVFPFSLKGDAQLAPPDGSVDISCIINFYGRIHLLEGILNSLVQQDCPPERFEVILVEDRGGTEAGAVVAAAFSSRLNIRYFRLTQNYGIMGYARNFALEKAQGKFILFLDDDTVILQKDFLSVLAREFQVQRCTAVVPHGSASYCLLKGKYDYHDHYFPTSRCMAYERITLAEMGGFVSEIVGQEDVEFVIRFIASGRTFFYSETLNYFHPPLIVSGFQKPAAVGLSFAKLRKRYPLIVWLFLLLNGSRFLPFLAFPLRRRWRMQGRFSLGFLLGVLYAALGKTAGYNES